MDEAKSLMKMVMFLKDNLWKGINMEKEQQKAFSINLFVLMNMEISMEPMS